MLHFIERKPLTGAGPAPTLILLHGYGANEEDLAWLSNEVDPRVHVVLPRAPVRVADFDGYQWYDPRGTGTPEPAGLEESLSALSSTLASLVRDGGVDPSHLLLGGFSQGGLMTAAYGARGLGPRPTALIILSGYLPPDARIADLKGLPVFLGHGQDDPVVPVTWGLGLARRLELAGASVEAHTYPGGHGMQPAELLDLTGFVRRHI